MANVETADYQHVVIFLHGVGGSGSEWARFLQKVVPPNTKLILPNAPRASVDLFLGREMSSWYNMYSSYSSNLMEVKNMAEVFHRIIKEEVDKGINPEDIVLGGFSQGEMKNKNSRNNFATSLFRWCPGSLHLSDQPCQSGRNIRSLRLPSGSLGVPRPQQTSDQLQLAHPHLSWPRGPEGAGAVGGPLSQDRLRRHQ